MSDLLGCLSWPFLVIWRLLSLILELTGRVIAIVLGLIVMILGVVISLTGIGAVIGIPLFLFGILLIVRGFF